MKLILSVLFFSILSFNASASIDGPACGDLTQAQDLLLAKAAIAYVSDYYAVATTDIEATNVDCHDYDGVHSSSEFEVTWTNANESCTGKVSVEADYEGEEKVINSKTTFTVTEEDSASCNPVISKK